MAKRPNKDGAGVALNTHSDYADHDAIIMNGFIEDELFARLTKCLSENRKAKNAVVTLVTYGGQANAAYRISRLLQGMYEDLTVFVPSLCKSAGTLITTAANTLVISPFGEIGPLDVQLLERDELGERKSGLTMRSALDDLQERSFELFSSYMLGIKKASGNSITFKLAAELARDVTIGLMGNVYSQVHPDVLGKDFRDLSVATQYGETLDKKFGNLKPDGIQRLVHGYPSHDYVIDHAEASEIFERVSLPSPKLWEMLSRRGNDLLVPNVNDYVVEIENWSIQSESEQTNDNRDTFEDAHVAAE